MGMCFEAKFGLNACPFHHPGEASRGEWRVAL